MRFYIRKRRQPPAVIIVALIDVLIVVLIFLMVTTTFKKPQATFRLVLPQSSQAAKAGASETPPLAIAIEKSGALRYGPDALLVSLDRLKAELAKAVANNPKLKVSVSSDEVAPVGQLIKVVDIAKEAKIQNTNLTVAVRQAAPK